VDMSTPVHPVATPLTNTRPDREADYCDERVCLPVCQCVRLSVRDHIFGTTRPIFIKSFVHVTHDRIRNGGSVAEWLASWTQAQ